MDEAAAGTAAPDAGAAGAAGEAVEQPSPLASYPSFCLTDEQRRRWDHSRELARKLFADDGELGPGSTPSRASDVEQAARAIYSSDIPTGADAAPSGPPGRQPVRG